ncbi:E3 ubiquitin-protein ligase TRIM39-like [Amblyraja radiata]|uniref:E3 ubiquitin-protein ligase TRIM39-like n=1 Tax=Amblyraja radiata TaxID=386614 RepID=UPI00140201F0|nr:E3 ubiquitin-protein ligase TRIM39-like [Amblyraja radiata]
MAAKDPVESLTEEATEKKSKLQCEKHQEELKLFCETDKKLICLVCAAGREHKSHSFMPLDEAVEMYKGQVKSTFESLTEKESDIQEEEQEQKDNICEVQEESHNLQSQVTHKDGVIFLKEEAGRKSRVSDETKTMLVVDGALPIEKFDRTFFYNMALRETSDIINRVSVTLDVETAHAWLEVSEDRKRVRWTGTVRSLPDTGKRFTVYGCVLGSEGFTSGRHYWEVEVAGSRDWSLGVAAESVERKGDDDLTPETGVWSIRRWVGGFVAFTSPRSPLPARPIPGRVGVYLSYESGTVSFYDADTKSHLHTFTGNKFTEKLYPFFWPWDNQRFCLRNPSVRLALVAVLSMCSLHEILPSR